MRKPPVRGTHQKDKPNGKQQERRGRMRKKRSVGNGRNVSSRINERNRMGRTGRTFTEYLKAYLETLSPPERAFYDNQRSFFAEENRRICQHREWYTMNPPVCVACGLVGKVD